MRTRDGKKLTSFGGKIRAESVGRKFELVPEPRANEQSRAATRGRFSCDGQDARPETLAEEEEEEERKVVENFEILKRGD